ncbi:MAG: hypothetical protein AAF409_05175 [Pseudomonadota bacterium]
MGERCYKPEEITSKLRETGVVEVLLNHNWISIDDQAAKMPVQQIYRDIFREDDLLSSMKIHALLKDIVGRKRLGFKGTSGTGHETPDETAAMMGL